MTENVINQRDYQNIYEAVRRYGITTNNSIYEHILSKLPKPHTLKYNVRISFTCVKDTPKTVDESASKFKSCRCGTLVRINNDTGKGTCDTCGSRYEVIKPSDDAVK